ncbi:unnamed protein product [marine sediment metagenome]|uniref:Uncharacterized protein n=1 Tax=marine sediment metagenome TaxID=412755 RepID=X0WAZ1_9ZZZZ
MEKKNKVHRVTEKERMDKKTQEAWELFMDDLKGAINLVGGCGDDRWVDWTLEEIFRHLYPNGIEFCFFLTKPMDGRVLGGNQKYRKWDWEEE